MLTLKDCERMAAIRVLHSPVMTKARKHRGTVYPAQQTSHNAAIYPEHGLLHIWGEYCGKSYRQVFMVGDTAIYDSFNLTYMGEITKIGKNTVTIQPSGDRKAHRLDLNEFCWRNAHLDRAKVAADNAEISMTI